VECPWTCAARFGRGRRIDIGAPAMRRACADGLSAGIRELETGMKCELCEEEYGAYELEFTGRIEVGIVTMNVDQGDGTMRNSNACRKCLSEAINRIGRIHGGHIQLTEAAI